MNQQTKKKVAVCDTQPVTTEGIKALLESNTDFEFAWAATSLGACLGAAREAAPDILIVDKAFGMQAVLEWIPRVNGIVPETKVVVWGLSMTEAEALRLLQAGARGILPKTASIKAFEVCLTAASSGSSWVDDSILACRLRNERALRNSLTDRECQVKNLVEQGFRNSDIARELGIRPGTVKIHLKHIFEKTGVRGRHSLALAGIHGRPQTNGAAQH